MSRIVHFEIHAVDAAREIAFYEDVFGWTFQPWGGGEQAYWLVTTGADGTPGINGGLMPSRDGQPRTVNTVEVDAVAAYVERVVAGGGEVVVPTMAVPGVGYVAYCKDPGGGLFGIFHTDATAA